MKEGFYFEQNKEKEKSRDIQAVRIERIGGAVLLEKEYRMIDEILKDVPPQKGEMKKFLESRPSFRKRLLSLMLASSFMLSPLAAFGKEDGETPEERTQVTYVEKENISDTVSKIIEEARGMREPLQEKNAETLIEETHNAVESYIQNLGTFKKLGLVKNIKENADTIRNFARNGDEGVFKKANKDLEFILTRYKAAFDKVKEMDEAAYQKATEELLDIVDTIEASSISELRKNKRFG